MASHAKRKTTRTEHRRRLLLEAASYPGMIPHDFRRAAVRGLVRVGNFARAATQLTGRKTHGVSARCDSVSRRDLSAAPV